MSGKRACLFCSIARVTGRNRAHWPGLAWSLALLLVWSCSSAAAAQAAPAREGSAPLRSDPALAGDILQFLDGSSLHGRLRSISTDQGVGWAHPDAKHVIQFRQTNLAWIRFAAPQAVLTADKPSC